MGAEHIAPASPRSAAFEEDLDAILGHAPDGRSYRAPALALLLVALLGGGSALLLSPRGEPGASATRVGPAASRPVGTVQAPRIAERAAPVAALAVPQSSPPSKPLSKPLARSGPPSRLRADGGKADRGGQIQPAAYLARPDDTPMREGKADDDQPPPMRAEEQAAQDKREARLEAIDAVRALRLR